MNTKFKFTDARIRALPTNPSNAKSTELEFSDTEITGLKCLSSKKAGSKRFLLRYVFQSRKRSLSLGRFPDINVATARKAAQRYRAMLAEGIDPKAENEEISNHPTVSEFFWNTYLPYQKKHTRSWKHEITRFSLHAEPRFGHMLFKDLKASHVLQLQLDLNSANSHRKALAPATCNRVIAVLKCMGQLALRMDVIDSNEAMKVKQLRENNIRMRFLDAKELKAVIAEARCYPNKQIGGIIALLAVTGCRSGELRLAKHEHLDKHNQILFLPMTKNGRSREVYLSDLAMEIINETPLVPGNPYLFAGRVPGNPISSFRIAFPKILKNAGIKGHEGLTPHHLRHSVASCLVSSGKSLIDVQYQLGHLCIQSSARYSKQTVERQRNVSDAFSELVR
ncbi:tyrosine-type recombinase/integrase [Neptuniibacter sp. QD29_5]|uniref:tyrosine-type recombinase/integrase n=1 Tax=Neptuniibacter sp. QD29_5 TaxID=3398207 RepID=UPI0039F5047D